MCVNQVAVPEAGGGGGRRVGHHSLVSTGRPGLAGGSLLRLVRTPTDWDGLGQTQADADSERLYRLGQTCV